MLDNKEILEEYLNVRVSAGDISYDKDFSLSGISTFGIGGKALYVVKPKSMEVFCGTLKFLKDNGIRYTVIGNGSNVLFDDRGYNGVILLTSSLSSIKRDGCTVYSECGVSLTYLSSYVQKEGLKGLSFAFGIPGTIGGAVFMNAGAYGGEIKDVVSEVTWYDTESDNVGKYTAEQSSFDYRDSIYQHENKIILSATFRLSDGDKTEIKAEMDDFMQRRISKQPLEYGSAGSTFKRYPGYFTGKLIDEAGLKGCTVGGAQVSEKHAGFVINKGGATSADVLELVSLIKQRIYEINGINIECEVRYIPYES